MSDWPLLNSAAEYHGTYNGLPVEQQIVEENRRTWFINPLIIKRHIDSGDLMPFTGQLGKITFDYDGRKYVWK